MKRRLFLMCLVLFSLFAMVSCNETLSVPSVENWDAFQKAITETVGRYTDSGDYHLMGSIWVKVGHATFENWMDMTDLEYPISFDYIHSESESYYSLTQSLRPYGSSRSVTTTSIATYREKLLVQAQIPAEGYAVPMVIDTTKELEKPAYGFNDFTFLLELPEPSEFKETEKGKCFLFYTYDEFFAIGPLAEWYEVANFDRADFPSEMKTDTSFIFIFTFLSDGSVYCECQPEPFHTYSKSKIYEEWIFDFSYRIMPITTLDKIDVFDGSYIVTPFNGDEMDVPLFSVGDTVSFYAKNLYLDYWIKMNFPKSGVYVLQHNENIEVVAQYFMSDRVTQIDFSNGTGEYRFINGPSTLWMNVLPSKKGILSFRVVDTNLLDYGDASDPQLVTENSITLSLEGGTDRICLSFPEITEGRLVFHVTSPSPHFAENTVLIHIMGQKAIPLTMTEEVGIDANPSTVIHIYGNYSGSFTLNWEFIPV